MIENTFDLDNYFMSIAIETSKRSNDPKTKVGACIVKNKQLLSLGYNDKLKNFPGNIIPNSSDSTVLKENKNSYMVHAEINAILNYPGNLKDLKNSIIYTTLSPCYECTKILIQLGIKKVIYLNEYHRQEVWNMSKLLLDTMNIKYVQISEVIK